MADAALIDALDHHTRTEATHAAARLAVIGEITARHCDDETDESAHQIIDGWETAAAAVSAACHLTRAAASTQMRIAQALRDRLPKVAAVFARGAIPAKTIATITWRTQNITDPDALTLIDTALAGAATTYSALSATKAEQAIDCWIHKFDPAAVRKTRTAARERDIHFGAADDPAGTVTLWGRLLTTDAELIKKLLNTMARDVCDNDPRTLGQRRSDALGALGAGANHLTCQCGNPDCPTTGTDPRSRAFVIHLLAQTLPTTTHNGDNGDDPDDGDDPDPGGDPGDRPDPDDNDRPDGDSGSNNDGDDDGSKECDGGSNGGDDRYHGPGAGPAPEPDSDSGSGGSADAAPAGPPRDPRIHGNPDPDYHADTTPAVTGTPAVLLGGGIIPAPLLAELIATGATVTALKPPQDYTAENHYRPSTGLATYIRLRDQRCMFPGCGVSAAYCDLDHCTPWPTGATHPANLGPKCRNHHLLKTFRTGTHGWTDTQHPDGSHTWTAPTGHTYHTRPFSQILFPDWQPHTPTPPTPPEPSTPPGPPTPPQPHRDTKMPQRKRTRAQNRTTRINTERRLNTENDKPPPF